MAINYKILFFKVLLSLNIVNAFQSFNHDLIEYDNILQGNTNKCDLHGKNSSNSNDNLN